MSTKTYGWVVFTSGNAFIRLALTIHLARQPQTGTVRYVIFFHYNTDVRLFQQPCQNALYHEMFHKHFRNNTNDVIVMIWSNNDETDRVAQHDG